MSNPIPTLSVIAAAETSAAQLSSGQTACVTTTNAGVTVIAADPINTYHHLRVFNAGTVVGFYSFDGGVTWHYLPASSSLLHAGVTIENKPIQVKRINDGSDLTGVYASLW